jgi:hypothetical protein
MAAPSRVLNPFNLDVDQVTHVAIYRQLDEHRHEANRPCNCTQCVANCLIYGAARVAKRTNPNTQEQVWVPKVEKDNRGDDCIDAISAKGMRDIFVGSCSGSSDLFVSRIIHEKYRALTRNYPSDYLILFDGDKKRKAKDDLPATQAKRPANTAMAASATMPTPTKTPVASSSGGGQSSPPPAPRKTSDKGKERAEVDLSNDDEDDEDIHDDDRTLSDEEN